MCQTSLNCDLRASPPPLATFGGPATAPPGSTELGIGVGGYGEGLAACPIDIVGATNWFVRWRRGVTGKTDLGFDVQVFDASNGTFGATPKIAARYEALKGTRLEGGIGMSDAGNGRSVNADLAAVMGTYKHPENTWNYYASVRLAGSHGCVNLLCLPASAAPGSRAPGALIPLGVVGATARASDTTRFVMECGLGIWESRQYPSRDLYMHLAFGVQFVVGKTSPKAPHGGTS